MATGVINERRRDFALIAVAAAAALGAAYYTFVRTVRGQAFDDLAFEGRSVQDPEATRVTNELLHDVTRPTLVLLTAALVLLALARRRVRLAFTVGAAVTASVVAAEVLKRRVFDRPDLDGIAGIAENSFPSGHATIGMSLALGLVMVSPHRWRWLALIVALGIAAVFGIGVLATGWHRPSDTLAAYLLCTAVFAAFTMLLLFWNAGTPTEYGDVEEHLSSGVMFVAGTLVIAAVVVGFGLTIRHESVRVVDYSTRYVVVCGALVVLAGGIVIGYHQLLRGLSLDPPAVPSDRRSATTKVDGPDRPRRRPVPS